VIKDQRARNKHFVLKMHVDACEKFRASNGQLQSRPQAQNQTGIVLAWPIAQSDRFCTMAADFRLDHRF
jgi:hypothetical protein